MKMTFKQYSLVVNVVKNQIVLLVTLLGYVLGELGFLTPQNCGVSCSSHYLKS